VLGAIAFLAPNSNRIGTLIHERVRSNFTRGAIGGLAGAAVLLPVVINTARDSVSAFIYLNF
jgi:alginate O-acetyltransferase complex protein AlgI